MDQTEFQQMWDKMQADGYFRLHPHYQDWHPDQADARERIPCQHAAPELEESILAVDFRQPEIELPAYSEALEGAMKQVESHWLPRMFDLPTAGTALDIGCGYGRSLEWLHQRFDQAIGVDISEYIIEVAKARFADIANTQFFPCGSDTLPEEIGENSVDWGYCFTVFQHIPREYTLNLLRDTHRVLKPGGRVVFNLVSGVNEGLNDGPNHYEWLIGYSPEQARALVAESGLRLGKWVTWKTPNVPSTWLWLEGIK